MDPKMINIALMIGIAVVFYFFMIRPQVQRQKKEKQFREGLSKGDKVMTIGGIHGKIVELDGEGSTALLEVDNGVRIRVEKAGLRAPGNMQAQR